MNFLLDLLSLYQMKSCGDDISDKKQVEKILISLPDKFIHIVSVIEESKDLSTLSIQKLMESLKSYEQRVKGFSENSMESAFQSKVSIKNKKSWSYDRGGSSRGRGGGDKFS